MPHVLVRSLESAALTQLKARAKRNGRSLQAELKAILEMSARQDVHDARWVAERIRRSLAGRRFTDSGAQQAQDRRR
jgi:plasmid stability protein